MVLELQDQGVLDEEQCRRCLDALEKQVRGVAGQPDGPPGMEGCLTAIGPDERFT